MTKEWWPTQDERVSYSYMHSCFFIHWWYWFVLLLLNKIPRTSPIFWIFLGRSLASLQICRKVWWCQYDVWMPIWRSASWIRSYPVALPIRYVIGVTFDVQPLISKIDGKLNSSQGRVIMMAGISMAIKFVITSQAIHHLLLQWCLKVPFGQFKNCSELAFPLGCTHKIHGGNARSTGRLYVCQKNIGALMRVNSANVLDEILRIGGRGHRMNSKVKIKQTRRRLTCIENKSSTQLAQSQSVPGRPLLAPLYRLPGLEEPVGFNTTYNVCIWCHLVFRLYLCLGLSNGPRGTKIMGFISYTLVRLKILGMKYCGHNPSGTHYWCIQYDPTRKPMRRTPYIWSAWPSKPMRTHARLAYGLGRRTICKLPRKTRDLACYIRARRGPGKALLQPDTVFPRQDRI
jgi:hypothetical protein